MFKDSCKCVCFCLLCSFFHYKCQWEVVALFCVGFGWFVYFNDVFIYPKHSVSICLIMIVISFHCHYNRRHLSIELPLNTIIIKCANVIGESVLRNLLPVLWMMTPFFNFTFGMMTQTRFNNCCFRYLWFYLFWDIPSWLHKFCCGYNWKLQTWLIHIHDEKFVCGLLNYRAVIT